MCDMIIYEVASKYKRGTKFCTPFKKNYVPVFNSPLSSFLISRKEEAAVW
jgi:hypothetical protein